MKIFETRDLNENILIDLDNDGNLIALTIEHAKNSVDISNFSYQQIPSIVGDIKPVFSTDDKILV
jgi:uncharacterized protein YuzE